MFYDPDANILNIELSNESIASAREFGNFIIHFSPKGKPVLIEILDANKFIKQFEKAKNLKNFKEAMSFY